MSVTLTGDNNYTGTYDNLWVLGGANNGGHDDTDNGSTDVFMFGNLGAGKTLVTDTSHDDTGTFLSSGTLQSTATGDSHDTLHFGFHFHPGSEGGVLGTFAGPSEDSQSALSTEYTAFLVSVGIDPAVWQQNNATDPLPGYGDGDVESITWTQGQATQTRYYEATPTSGEGTDAYFTVDHSGNKTLLGFSVDSDHIALDGVTEAQFEQYFTINASSHTSANNNTVNDTVISLGNWDNSTHTSTGGWSVDLYGVSVATLQANAASLGYSNDTKGLADYVYEHIA